MLSSKFYGPTKLIRIMVIVTVLICCIFLHNFQVVVLLVGTNNYHSSAEQVVEGIETIVWSITSKLPSAKVIVLVRPCAPDFRKIK